MSCARCGATETNGDRCASCGAMVEVVFDDAHGDEPIELDWGARAPRRGPEAVAATEPPPVAPATAAQSGRLGPLYEESASWDERHPPAATRDLFASVARMASLLLTAAALAEAYSCFLSARTVWILVDHTGREPLSYLRGTWRASLWLLALLGLTVWCFFLPRGFDERLVRPLRWSLLDPLGALRDLPVVAARSLRTFAGYGAGPARALRLEGLGIVLGGGYFLFASLSPFGWRFSVTMEALDAALSLLLVCAHMTTQGHLRRVFHQEEGVAPWRSTPAACRWALPGASSRAGAPSAAATPTSRSARRCVCTRRAAREATRRPAPS